MPGLLDKALAAVEWPQLREDTRCSAAPPANSSAPASRCSSRRAGSARSTRCGSASMSDGTVEVVTGAASVGQGVETVIAQICADALGVDYRKVRVVHGQTDRIERGHGRLRLARHRDDRRGDADRRERAAERRRSRPPPNCCRRRPTLLDVIDGEVVRTDAAAGPSIGLGAIARALVPGSNLASRASGRTIGRGLVHTQPHELSLRRAHRGHARRPETGAVDDRALPRRLRRRPGGQSDADRRPDRRRLRAGHRRRAARGVPLRRARRAAVGDASPTT